MNKQQEIITALGVQSEIDPEQEITKRTQALQDYLAQTGMNGFVLGISGGQDSLLAGMLTQRAVNARRQEGDDTVAFHAMLLPYGKQADRADAELAIDVIKPDVVHEFNIKAATDAVALTFCEAEHRPLADFHKGNVKARMRMIAQYAIAGENDLLVVGTDHAAEAVSGFFTKYGDGGADVLPLSGLTKGQGRQLLQALGAPARFYTKKPTADLLDGTPGNPDETELGISYDTIDAYLRGEAVDRTAAWIIERRYDQTEHKRNLPVELNNWSLTD